MKYIFLRVLSFFQIVVFTTSLMQIKALPNTWSSKVSRVSRLSKVSRANFIHGSFNFEASSSSTDLPLRGNLPINGTITFGAVDVPGGDKNNFQSYIRNRVLVFRKAWILFMKSFGGLLTVKAKSSSPMGFYPTRRGGRGPKLSQLVQKLFTAIFTPKSLIRLGLLFIIMFFMNKYIGTKNASVTELPFSSFLAMLSESPERIKALKVSPASFMYFLDGKSAFTRVVQLPAPILDKLLSSGIEFAAPKAPKNIFGMVWSFAYIVFMWKIASRMLQGPQDEGVGKTRDKMNLEAYGSLSFDDIAGQETAKSEVKEVCDMLRDPTKYISVGARLPSGILLVGPPGSGKTLLARVTAAEAKVPFYACSASDFVEVFVGRGPARVRKLFKSAAENAPSIVFIDEIDSIGRSRRMGSMNSEQESTLNQLLTSMDGLDTSNNGVIVMAATNRLELLDPALLRAGRFDRIIQCPLPNRTGRLEILLVHSRKMRLANDVDLDRIAKATPGMSGADLGAVVNEASIRTARRGGSAVSNADFDDALKSFMSARSFSLSGLAEIASNNIIPDWLRGGKDDLSPLAS